MSDNLSRLCQIDITLDNPVQSSSNFDCLLLIGDAPKTPKADVPKVGVYANLNEVKDIGWVAEGDDAEPVGRAARIAFSQSPRPDQIYIAVRQDKADADPGTPEKITDTLDRALNTDGWYAICPCGVEESEYKTIGEWTETQEKIFVFSTTATENPVGSLLYRSMGIYAKHLADAEISEVPADNLYVHVALTAKCLCYEAGSETWANMIVNGITPASINSNTVKTLEDQNLSYVIKVGGQIISQGGMTAAGEWIDIIRFRDWLKNDMGQRVCDLLIRNPKIPYTDNGIGAVENQVIASLKAGQVREGIAKSEFDEMDQEVPGYKTWVPLASSLTSAQRSSRVLRNCKFWARIAGAIHMVEIEGSLTYTF